MADDSSTSRPMKKPKLKKPTSIAEMPDNVIHAILARLPILDAVRTSVLSKHWRHKWSAMTCLHFSDDLIRGCFSDVVDRVLLLHSGPIHSFAIYTARDVVSFSRVDHWIVALSRRNGVRELDLSFYDNDYYTVHSSLFACREMAVLRLYGCMLRSPPVFESLLHLSKLHLMHTKISRDSLERLIVNCPLLEELSLVAITIQGADCLNIRSVINLRSLFLLAVFYDSDNSHGGYAEVCIETEPISAVVLDDVRVERIHNASNINGGFLHIYNLTLWNIRISSDCVESLISNCPLLEELLLQDVIMEGSSNCLNIRAINLRTLRLIGEFYEFFLVDTPVLAKVHIEMHRWLDFDDVIDEGICVSKILFVAKSIENLKLLGSTTKYLAIGSKQEKLPFVFPHLTSLCLVINFAEVKEISFLLSLLRSSTCLQELKIMASVLDVDRRMVDKKIWKTCDDEMEVFSHLQFLHISIFGCIKPKLKFVKFLLTRAPVLQKMEVGIRSKGAKVKEQILIKLVKFKRVSKHAEIIIV